MNGPTDNYLSIVLSVAIIMWYFTPSIMYVTDLRLIQHIRSVELFDVIVLLFYVAVMNWPVNRDFDRDSNGDADDYQLQQSYGCCQARKQHRERGSIVISSDALDKCTAVSQTERTDSCR